jgi:predicted aspartyl protease
MRYYLCAFCGLLAIGGLAPGPQASGEAAADSKPPQKKPMALRVPFDTIPSQHMVIQVKINGKGPYRMIFDTGAPFTLVNNKTAKEANVFPKDYKKPFMLFNPFNQSGSLKLETVQIGEITLKNLQAQVMDHPTVAAVASVVGPLEGIVGFNFFAQ